MSGNAHLAFGISNGLLIIHVIKPEPIASLAMLGVTAAASLLVDIDSRNSKVGNKFSIVSFLINSLCGHRTLLHSPFLLMIVYLLVNRYLIGIGIIVGYGGHLIQDLMTKGGIPLFYPISKQHFKLLPFKTGGISDWITTSCLILGSWMYFRK